MQLPSLRPRGRSWPAESAEYLRGGTASPGVCLPLSSPETSGRECLEGGGESEGVRGGE